MTLTLPDFPPLREDEVRLELACALYASRKLARGSAAQVAGVGAEAFEKELHRRGITNGCQAGDLVEEMATVEKLFPR